MRQVHCRNQCYCQLLWSSGLKRSLGYFLHHVNNRNFLKTTLPQRIGTGKVFGTDLTGKHNEWNTVKKSIGDAGYDIGSARSAGHGNKGWCTRNYGISEGHITGTLFGLGTDQRHIQTPTFVKNRSNGATGIHMKILT